ncbi:MAG: T9SS type A sorting domain-containing protein [Bacteroidia bacterium]
MKKLLLLVFTLTGLTAFSQYEGFENWSETSINILDGYLISNIDLLGSGIENTTRSEDAQDGDYSIRMETILYANQDTVFGFFLSGDPDGGLPGQAIGLADVDSIIGYYKAGIMSGDSCTLLCEIIASGAITGGGVFYLNQSQTEWTRFAFAANAATADSMTFAMATGNPLDDFSGIPGTWLMVDNIQLKAADGTLAPIVNHSFEEWDAITFEEPDGWVSANSYAGMVEDYPIQKSTDAHSGMYAIELNTLEGLDMEIIEGVATNGVFSEFGGVGGMPYTETPSAIELYYKYSPGEKDDIAFARFTFISDGVPVGDFPAVLTASDEYQLWTQLIDIPQPDTLEMILYAGELVGSKLTVDDINFLFTVGENEAIKVDQVVSYPNPVINLLNIRYHLKDNAEVHLYLTDVNGKMVTSISKGNQLSGTYNETVNTAKLASGIYFLIVETQAGKISRQIIIN